MILRKLLKWILKLQSVYLKISYGLDTICALDIVGDAHQNILVTVLIEFDERRVDDDGVETNNQQGTKAHAQ